MNPADVEAGDREIQKAKAALRAEWDAKWEVRDDGKN